MPDDHLFPNSVIESLAKALGEFATGTEITTALQQCAITDNSGHSTKWRRLYAVFVDLQQRDQSANSILRFIGMLLAPARFIGRNDDYEHHRESINAALSFVGVEYQADASIRRRGATATIPEAERCANAMRAKLYGRRIHPEVLKYCKAELMQENYFHAVFEAVKGLAKRIGDMSGTDGDGAALVDRAFAVNKPLVAFNKLQTETEQSEHKGFATLLKGCFAAIRNPLAHQPKILWKGKTMQLITSLLHRKLDDSFKIQFNDGA